VAEVIEKSTGNGFRLHPEFHAILRYLRERGVTIALTSNGHTSAAVRSDDEQSISPIPSEVSPKVE